MTKIKICGLTRKRDIDAVNAVLPDYIGFVFTRSSRQICIEDAKALKSCLNPYIKAVGVFVDEEIENVVRLCSSHVIDLVQLHGDENERYIKELKSCVPNKIIKAVRVRGPEDIKKAVDFSCDYLLFDTHHEGKYGGSGRTFDWSMIHNVSKPYFLAGGINSGNVFQAIEQCKPYCIDVSSGVETDGYKDPEKIMDIVTKVRGLKDKSPDKQQFS
jgi:phosphoribosylanthranilate isomerase